MATATSTATAATNNTTNTLFTPKQIQNITTLLTKYPITYPPNISKFSYGTAGFRYNSKYLPCIFVRMGIFSTLRSLSFNGEYVGIMCTASHNPKNDNGIKCVDSNGDMLHSSLETIVENIINASTTNEFINYVTLFCNQFTINNIGIKKANIHFGHDTRSSSVLLTNIAIEGAMQFLNNTNVINHGYVTTPQLHYIVLHSNTVYLKLTNIIPNPNEHGYWDTMCTAYMQLLQTSSERDNNNDRIWYIDCACGVGYNKVFMLNKYLSTMNDTNILLPKFIPRNNSNLPHLNELCGADYVQKNQSLPKFYNNNNESNNTTTNNKQYASFDGDADRIVFYYLNNNNNIQNQNKFILLDGDKIAIVITKFLQEYVLQYLQPYLQKENISIGIVQTSYANGASKSYIKKHMSNIDISVSKTGVKYLHKTCTDNYDIGIYFESNGHGTVLFSTKFYNFLKIYNNDAFLKKEEEILAMKRLLLLPKLINQSVGDSFSNLLLIDAILYLYGWTTNNGNNNGLELWNNSLYIDLPSRQLKVVVPDRSIIQTNDNESKVLHPVELQNQIDNLVNEMNNSGSSGSSNNNNSCRCFVRPSGTENIVRVYAEGNTQDIADMLAEKTKNIVEIVCNKYSNSKL